MNNLIEISEGWLYIAGMVEMKIKTGIHYDILLDDNRVLKSVELMQILPDQITIYSVDDLIDIDVDHIAEMIEVPN